MTPEGPIDTMMRPNYGTAAYVMFERVHDFTQRLVGPISAVAIPGGFEVYGKTVDDHVVRCNDEGLFTFSLDPV